MHIKSVYNVNLIGYRQMCRISYGQRCRISYNLLQMQCYAWPQKCTTIGTIHKKDNMPEQTSQLQQHHQSCLFDRRP